MKKYSVFFPALFLTLSTMPSDVFAATTCKTEVEDTAFRMWSFGPQKNDLFRKTDSANVLAVKDDTELYNKYKGFRLKEILDEKNKESKTKYDNYVFKSKGDSLECKYITKTYSDCPNKKLKDCDENLYNACLDVAQSMNTMDAEQQARNEYEEALVKKICASQKNSSTAATTATTKPTTSALTQTASGTVNDSEGPITGASVVAIDSAGKNIKDKKNNLISTITDANGYFKLDVPEGSRLKISYIGKKTQTIDDIKVKLNVTLVEDSKELETVNVTKDRQEGATCGAVLIKDVNANKDAKGKYKKVNNEWICVPNECIQDYKLEGNTCKKYQCSTAEKESVLKTGAKGAKWDGAKCVPSKCDTDNGYTENEKNECVLTNCTKAQLQALKQQNGVADGKLENGKCVPVCKDKYHLENGKCEKNKCDKEEEDWDGKKCVKVRCTTDELNEIHTIQKYAKWDEAKKICIATECSDKKNFKLSDGKCITNDCPAKELEKINATTGYMQDGKCIPNACKGDYSLVDGACTNKKALEEKQKAYDKAHETEQSFENRALTAVTTAATGIGGMQLMQGLAEQSSDKDAAADMAAYIETMRCTYGEGKQVKAGPEEIELPGANDAELMKLRNEYLALAADLKERKEALGMKPGIESETILDRSATGLYDDENVGITSGNYASLYRAQALKSEADQAKIDDASKTSSNRVKYGAIAAGAGVAVGVVGNSLINGKLGEMLKSNKSSTQGKSLKAAAKTEHEALKDLQKCLKDAGVKDTDELEFTKFYPSVLSVKNIKCKTEITKIANNDAKNVSATTIFADSNDAATIYNKLKESFGATITGKMIGVTLNSDPTDTQNSTAINTLKTALEKVEKRFQDAAKEDEKGFSASDLKDSGVDYSSFMSSLQGDDKSSSIMGLVNGSI